MENQKEHYLVLDAARGIAAIVIMLCHLRLFIYPDLKFTLMPFLFDHGALAVDLFFLMSGLVVARAYGDKLRTGKMSFFSFCMTRLIRLYPLYLAGTFLGLVYFIINAMLPPIEEMNALSEAKILLANLLFIPNLLNTEKISFPYNPAAWSLALEWFINLLYALWAVRRSTYVLCSIVFVSGIFLAKAVIEAGTANIGWGSDILTNGSLRICFSFTLGIVLYRFLQQTKIKIPVLNVWILLSLLILSLTTPLGMPNAYSDLFCIFIFFPAFVIFSCVIRAPDLFRSSFDKLGRISYALYILHSPLLLWSMSGWKHTFGTPAENMPFISIPVVAGFTLLISWLATIWFDEPVRTRLIKKFRNKPDRRELSAERPF